METTDFLFTVPQPFKWTQRNFFGISNLQLYVILIMDDTTPYRLDYFQMFVILAMDDTIPIDTLVSKHWILSILCYQNIGLLSNVRNFSYGRYNTYRNIG
uniref:Uncharacterized protein n=1 Tax=Cacopsylla melanoneura TaxID=428564 RepID=A0A8D8SWQ0_9HEMI